MIVHLPLIVLIAFIAYLGIKLTRVPGWLVVLLILGGYLSASTVLAPALHTAARASVGIINGTGR